MAKIIFMGTSDFACRCLDSLEKDKIDVQLVITRPDSLAGRNRKPSMPPVKKWALKRGIEVWQPKNINSQDSVERLKELNPDLAIVVAYGRILKPQVLDLPKWGCINVHASLLPDLRGAAPIEWAIMKGYNKTGVTTMFMDSGLDTGDIILRSETPIDPRENSGSLRDRLAEMSQDLLPRTVRMILLGIAPRRPQPAECIDYAPVLENDMEVINWDNSAQDIVNHVRAFAPKPGAYTWFRNKRLKILDARVHEGAGEPGVAKLEGKNLYIGSKSGLVELSLVQPEGKKKISGAEFYNGYRIQEGEKLQ